MPRQRLMVVPANTTNQARTGVRCPTTESGMVVSTRIQRPSNRHNPRNLRNALALGTLVRSPVHGDALGRRSRLIFTRKSEIPSGVKYSFLAYEEQALKVAFVLPETVRMKTLHPCLVLILLAAAPAFARGADADSFEEL